MNIILKFFKFEIFAYGGADLVYRKQSLRQVATEIMQAVCAVGLRNLNLGNVSFGEFLLA